MTILVTVVAPLMIGYLLVRALLQSAWPNTLLHLSLGVGCGIGVLSLIHFLVQLTLGPSMAAKWSAEAVASLAAVGVAYFLRPRRAPAESARLNVANVALLLALAVAIAVQWSHFNRATEAMPNGQWDAWALWNLRAAFLTQPDATWQGAYSPRLFTLAGGFATHADYPLLLSGFIARCWALTGSVRDAFVPSSVAGLFSLATITLLVSALGVLRSWSAGAIGGILLLSVSTFTRSLSSQYADVPVSFFFLATLVLLFLDEHDRAESGFAMSLAGFTAGCAAWTKNEGLLFAVVSGVVLLIVAAMGKLPARKLLRFATGAAVPLAIALYFKFWLAPSGDSGHYELQGQLANGSRYSQIVAAFWNELLQAGSGITHPAALIAVLVFTLGVSRAQLRSARTQAALGMWGMMLAGYFVVYVVTPYDLKWQLRTSVQRVLGQLVPIAIFLLVSVCRTPEETIVTENSISGPGKTRSRRNLASK